MLSTNCLLSHTDTSQSHSFHFILKLSLMSSSNLFAGFVRQFLLKTFVLLTGVGKNYGLEIARLFVLFLILFLLWLVLVVVMVMMLRLKYDPY